MNAHDKQHGQVAIAAVKRCRAGESPATAWQHEIDHATSTAASRSKSCPRHAFIGLAAAGLIKGVTRRDTSRDSVNAQYAVFAVECLHANPALGTSWKDLWREVHKERGRVIKHNGQMDVVLALWHNGELN